MCGNKNNNNRNNGASVEINTRNDELGNFQHVNASVESGNEKPIDLTLMTGNRPTGNSNGGE